MNLDLSLCGLDVRRHQLRLVHGHLLKPGYRCSQLAYSFSEVVAVQVTGCLAYSAEEVFRYGHIAVMQERAVLCSELVLQSFR